MKIKYKIEKGKHLLSCKELEVSDFGDTLEEAKINFLISCRMKINAELNDIFEYKK
jgi:hypothetical protein